MKTYRKNFQRYLNDLAAKKPAPGGGSAAALSFCLGISLIEKAINYSIKDKVKLKTFFEKSRYLRAEVLKIVDLDAKIFEKLIKAKGKYQKIILRQSEKLIITVGKSSLLMLSAARALSSQIKKSIVSDFRLGYNFINLALKGCIFNLEANSHIFKERNKYIDIFRAKLMK